MPRNWSPRPFERKKGYCKKSSKPSWLEGYTAVFNVVKAKLGRETGAIGAASLVFTDLNI